MLYELNKFLGEWQYIWFFLILLSGLAIEAHSNYMLRKEFDYDKAKDDKKRTRTTRKTTKQADGGTVTEETTETTESVRASTPPGTAN